MKQPKFRAYNREDKRMYYPCSTKNDTSIIFNEWGWEIFDHFTGKPKTLLTSWVEGDQNKENSNAVLMQSTGHKDKNKVEIFEGDIFYHERLLDMCFVTYNYEACAFQWSSMNFEYYKNRRITDEIKEYKVVGNIYEDPDLK